MLSASLAFAPSAYAQNTETSPASKRARITGTVLDAATGQPLATANVFLLGTPITATTGPDGKFAIPSAPPGVWTLEAKRLGYGAARLENIRLKADSVTTLEFKLTDRPMILDQVTVAATVDAQSATKSTFATTVVTAENMPVSPQGTAANMLAGKAAGVNITRASGRPGSGVNILLRSPIGGFDQIGGASGNGSAPGPLFIVDGVYLNQTQQVTTQDLETMDVASIEVIKGAAAAALYGARAAAGVIAITTNRGKGLTLGTTQFQIRNETGGDQFLTHLSKNQHHQFLQDASGNWLNAAGAIVPRPQRVLKPLGIMDAPYTSPTFDNVKQVYELNYSNSQTASVSGSFPASNYYVSYTRKNTPGVIKYNEGLKQQSIKVNVDSRPGEKVSFGVSASHSRVVDDGDPVSYNALYQFDTDVDLLRIDPVPKLGFPYIIVPDSVNQSTNPLYSSYIYDNVTRRARTNLNVNGTYRPFQWMSLTAEGSYDRGDLQRTRYQGRGTPVVSNGGLATSSGYLAIETDITDGYTLKSGITLKKNFGPLTISVSDIGQTQRETNPSVRDSGSQFLTEGLKAMSQASVKSVFQSFTDSRQINNITTATLSFNERYILDFLVNREGNSRFGRENRWNTFGRASGAWLIQEEKWFPLQAQFSQFKLRYSWGLAGFAPGFSQQYEALGTDGTGGITRNTLGNPHITPLKSYESELGLDFTAFGKLQGQFTYVRNRTKDNFIATPAPAVSGYCCVTSNPGENAGQTLEGTLNMQVFNRRGFQGSVNIIADKSRNIITAFRRTCFTDGINRRCEGQRDGEMTGHFMVKDKANLLAKHANSGASFDQNDDGYIVAVGTGNTYKDGVAKSLWGTNVTIDGTTYRWGMPIVQFDENGLQKETIIGDGNPTVHFGIQPDFRYKGFRMYFLFDGKLGGNTYNNFGQALYTSGDDPTVDQFGKPDELKKPVAYYNAVANNNSDYQQDFVKTGTFGRLNEFMIGYTLDSKKANFLKKVGVSNARFDLVGRNLKVFTKYPGLNVDGGSPSHRVDDVVYPQTRNWSGVITLTF